jgi:hypothetical protein
MQQQNLNITLDKTSSVTCDECGKDTFKEVYLLRKASRFVTGTSQDALIPIPVFACSKCSHVNDEFLPQQLKRDEDIETFF